MNKKVYRKDLMQRPDLTTDVHRLTAEEFKGLVKFKGWTLRAAAVRWGITPEYLSEQIRNSSRSVKFDDMARGLPNLHRVRAEEKKLDYQLATALKRFQKADVQQETPAKWSQPGYRYHTYYYVGAIVSAAVDVGSIAEEGARGVVIAVTDDGVQESYAVLFESGEYDWFTPGYVDSYLCNTGLDMPSMTNYRFINEDELRSDFEQGIFDFWPVVN